MNLYDLGKVPWLHSQLLYHALPRAGGSGIILLSPATPYVCIGYHQDAAQEVDLDFCREHGIPVFRREVGGGAVYLDGNQLFYQIVLPPDHPAAQGDKESIYRRLLAPVVRTYQAIGIPAEYKPINDIIAGGRKISGNGAAEIAGCTVLVGNLILDFNHEMMARVLRVPDEKFRDKVFKTLKDNLTTIRQELGRVPPVDELKMILVREFEAVLGPLEPSALPADVYRMADDLAPRMTSEEWLLGRGRPGCERDVKIQAGVHVVQRAYKARGGLIRALMVVRDERIAELELSGDFFIYPAERLGELERALIGARVSEVESVLAEFYQTRAVESPGVGPADFAEALRVPA
ncbi:MAG: lipoate protein ligase C-terminal domain-containing protein [Anaerolineales bacterium]